MFLNSYIRRNAWPWSPPSNNTVKLLRVLASLREPPPCPQQPSQMRAAPKGRCSSIGDPSRPSGTQTGRGISAGATGWLSLQSKGSWWQNLVPFDSHTYRLPFRFTFFDLRSCGARIGRSLPRCLTARTWFGLTPFRAWSCVGDRRAGSVLVRYRASISSGRDTDRRAVWTTMFLGRRVLFDDSLL
jgi:hypothetical protein